MYFDFNRIPNQNVYGYDTSSVDKGRQGEISAEVSTGTENLKQTVGGSAVSSSNIAFGNAAAATESVNAANTTNTQTLVRALEAANIVVTKETLNMVDLMMKEGMNVDKESLQNMYRLLLKHPEVDPKQLLTMKALSIEINDLSIRQFSQYAELNHQLTEGFQTLGEDTQALLSKLTDTGKSQTVMGILKEMNTLFADGNTGIDLTNVQKIADADGLIKQMLGMLNKSPFQTKVEGNAYANQLLTVGEFLASYAAEGGNVTAQELQILFKQLGQMSKEASSAENLLLLKNEAGDLQSILSSLRTTAPDGVVAGGMADEMLKAIKGNMAESTDSALHQLPAEQKATLINELKTSYLQLKQAVAQLSSDSSLGGIFHELELANANLKDVMRRFSENMKRILDNEVAGDTRLSKEIKNFFSEQLLLEPAELADDNKVKDFYNNLTDKLHQLTNTLDNAGLSQSQLSQSAGQMRENMYFMNQLNQFFQYVQLPVKMHGGGKNGELYVYSNKKNLADSDGNLSALLHLDMDHIGPLDVYVELSASSKVSTNFLVKDEEILDFIEQYLPMLNERLQMKGYQVEASASIKLEDEPKSVMAHMMEKKSSTVRAKLLKSTSFDMKV